LACPVSPPRGGPTRLLHARHRGEADVHWGTRSDVFPPPAPHSRASLCSAATRPSSSLPQATRGDAQPPALLPYNPSISGSASAAAGRLGVHACAWTSQLCHPQPARLAATFLPRRRPCCARMCAGSISPAWRALRYAPCPSAAFRPEWVGVFASSRALLHINRPRGPALGRCLLGGCCTHILFCNSWTCLEAFGPTRHVIRGGACAVQTDGSKRARLVGGEPPAGARWNPWHGAGELRRKHPQLADYPTPITSGGSTGSRRGIKQ
jgi:hypothetical protein